MSDKLSDTQISPQFPYEAAQPRDLRKIDSRVPNLVPTILTRKEAVLVRMLVFRGHQT